MSARAATPLDAFCIDSEEWFHVCDVDTPYRDPATWDSAPACVERDIETLFALLAETGTKATFPTLGWLAEKYPRLVRRMADLGHEVGCHGYYHRLVYRQSPAEFREEVSRARRILQDVSGQEVTCYRAPGFSITRECLWAYPILAELGFKVDISIVPAARDHGGIADFEPDPFRLRTPGGELVVFPVSVMRLAGRTVPFSGGGYLRLFPMPLVRWGFRQNHRAGRPVMAYIHPREINPGQPRLAIPGLKGWKYYVGLDTCEAKLRGLLRAYRFATVAEVLKQHPPRNTWEYRDGTIVPLPAALPA
jgi:polysaccharide deacetylase family protein (PEP-CTERM system associated)